MSKKTILLLLCLAIGLSTPVFALDYASQETVKQVQEALNAAGYDCGTPDGVAGNMTKSQIEKYRSDKGLTAGSEIDAELCQSLGLEDAVEEGSEKTKEELQEELKTKYHVTWFGDVRNDKTGNWRLAEYSSQEPFENFALDYYKAFVENDKEVHAVINMAAKVTYRLNITFGDLYITALDYIKGGEHDANVLFSGDVLGQFVVHTKDGSIEKLEEEEEEDAEIDQIIAETFMETIRPVMEDSFGADHCTLSCEDNTVFCGVWDDGIGLDFLSAKSGNAQSYSAYTEMKSIIEETALAYTNALQSYDRTAHFVLSIQNDLNLDNTLLMFYDGICVYDVVTEK